MFPRRATAEVFAALVEKHGDGAMGALYTKNDDGSYRLSGVEGLDEDRNRVNEFRDNNIEANRTIDALKEAAKVFEGLDPAKARAALAKVQELEDKKLLDAGDIEKLLEQRTAQMVSTHDALVLNLNETNEKSTADLEAMTVNYRKIVIDEAIRTAAMSKDLGVQKTAVGDFVTDARAAWRLNEDGQAVAYQGDSPLFVEGQAMTPEQWINTHRDSHPHRFEGSGGGGADGGGNNNNGKRITMEQLSQGDGSNLEKVAKGEMQVEVVIGE